MKEPFISDLFHFQNRFLRSTHLERDFSDPRALEGYVVTSQIEENIRMIADGLDPSSGRRAWKITGDFGSGKSSFALFLANLFSDRTAKLPRHLLNRSGFDQIDRPSIDLLPILITGSRESLSCSVVRAVLRELDGLDNEEGLRDLRLSLRAALGPTGKVEISDREIVSLITECGSTLSLVTRYSGLLVIIDELGKFLEYSTLNPGKQDIYLLQQLAEASNRSKNNPILLVGLLHQGFSDYADYLSPVAQREWEKISGRFEQITLDHPLEQIVGLIGSALNIQSKKLPASLVHKSGQLMKKALDIGWYRQCGAEELLIFASGVYPLHPTVLPILVEVFSRFGQFQRSLFSFLISDEPLGLTDFARQPLEPGNFYQLYNLYDYVRAAFGHRLSTQSYRSQWNLIESLIESFPATEKIDVQILKTIGLLNLIDSPKYRATEDVVVACVADPENGFDEGSVKQAIKRLHTDQHVLHSRGNVGGYCLWSYTSVNLDIAYERASQALNQINFQRVSSLLRTYINPRPIVARRHYIETGTLRHFEVHFSSVEQMGESLTYDPKQADGRIVVPLCETNEEHEAAVKLVKNLSSSSDSNVLVAIPRPLDVLGKLFQEVQKWEWIVQNTPELSSDTYASQEVARHLSAARHTLDKRIQSLVGLYQFKESTDLRWFFATEEVSIGGNRNLVEFLSKLCDQTFSLAPKVHNELINRREPSAVANKARTQLLTGIFESSLKPYLGMNPDKKPPEMGIYLSILQRSGIHRIGAAEDEFEIALPAEGRDVCNLLPAFTRIGEILEENADSRVNIALIIDLLSLPPFGVRKGLCPLLIAIFAVINEQHIAFYDNGTFMREMKGLDILRFTKAPNAFEIQYCKVAGFRAEFYRKLLNMFEEHPNMATFTSTSKNDKKNVLNVVRPLCIFAADLPPYTLKTKRLSPTTLTVRNALLGTTEPATLLFKELPAACGFDEIKPDASSVEVEELVDILKSNIKELQRAYLELHNRMLAALRVIFGLSESISNNDVRRLLAERSEDLLSHAKETRLKGFCLQVADSMLSDADWLDSLGSFVVSVPPRKWLDLDEEKYVQELESLAQRFQRLESIFLVNGNSKRGQAVFRLSLTRSDGLEVEKIIHSSKNSVKEIEKISDEIGLILKGNKELGLSALAHLIWTLNESNEKEN